MAFRPIPSRMAFRSIPSQMASQPIPSRMAFQPIPSRMASQPIPSRMASQPIPSWMASRPIPSRMASRPIPSWMAFCPPDGSVCHTNYAGQFMTLQNRPACPYAYRRLFATAKKIVIYKNINQFKYCKLTSYFILILNCFLSNSASCNMTWTVFFLSF